MTWHYHHGVYQRKTELAKLEIVRRKQSGKYRWRITTWRETYSLPSYTNEQDAAKACDEAYELMVAQEVGRMVLPESTNRRDAAEMRK